MGRRARCKINKAVKGDKTPAIGEAEADQAEALLHWQVVQESSTRYKKTEENAI